jgi:hypothetical protein
MIGSHRIPKTKLHSFRMVESKTIAYQLTEFNKMLDDLVNIEVEIEDEDKSILLLCVLPISFKHFTDIMLYGK